MTFDAGRAAERLGLLARGIVAPDRGRSAPRGGWPSGALSRDYTRSPAAARVAHLAADAGLFLFHHEHRAHLPLPEDFVPPERPELADPPEWEAGVLPERKYQAFRHDLPIGGMNPGHRAKWTTHELCHGLVGFAWRHDATRFFHACAGRLAELLPVALWYFLDEAYLRRCPAHEGGGALFRDLCPACEGVVGAWPEDPGAGERLEAGARFIDRELAALARSRRLGLAVPHQWATIDLCSDGIAYADAHGARLGSDAFADFAARFLVEDGGWVASLDALEARVIAVAKGIVGEAEPPPLAPTPVHGRWRWTVQDVAWRLISVACETDGEARDALDGIVERLAGVIDVTRSPADADTVDTVATGALEAAIAAYAALCDEYELPPCDALFGVGHPLPDGHGSALGQLEDGVRSALPGATRLLGPTVAEVVAAFAPEDVPTREPLAVRFARWLTQAVPGAAAELARYEAALAHPPLGDKGVARALGWDGTDDRRRLSPNVAVHRFSVDVVALADALAEGQVLPSIGDPITLVIGRDGRGDVLVLDVLPETADALLALGDGVEPDLDASEASILEDLGVLAPVAWTETTG